MQAVTTAVGLEFGLASSLFAVALCFTLVTMYDAAGVRYHSGRLPFTTPQFITLACEIYAKRALPPCMRPTLTNTVVHLDNAQYAVSLMLLYVLPSRKSDLSGQVMPPAAPRCMPSVLQESRPRC